MRKVGDKLYELRLQHELSQKQLGEKLGVTRQTISLWEANRRRINAEKLKLICEVLEVSPDYFLVDDVIDSDTCSISDELNVVCAEQDRKNEYGTNYTDINLQIKKRKLASKSIILISVIAVGVVVGIIAVIIGKMLTPPKQGFETAAEKIYSFNFGTLGWIILSISAVVVLSVIAILVRINWKSRKKKN